MTSRFSPIAIVGRACVLPGASSPRALEELVFARGIATGPVPEGRWVLRTDEVIAKDPSGDKAWSSQGGYVRESVTAAGIDASLDPLVHWLAKASSEALLEANLGSKVPRDRIGAIVGNLSFPTDGLAAYAEKVWLENTSLEGALTGTAKDDARNRFMSAWPIQHVAKTLGLGGPTYALDAACASSLYAIAHAARALHEGRADAMIAGAIARADDLFIHIGFCSLQALSKTGQSRPFHRDADGLLPAEGCALVVLRRLEDAVRDGDRILGVIRGVGLSNDGRARGLLAPSEEGQIRALNEAYEGAGLSPDDVDYVECHATGTPIGDATELRSMRAVFGNRRVPIGSLKGNLGHLITAAGTAGVLKVLGAFAQGALPPTPFLDDANTRNQALHELGFDVVTDARPWLQRDASTPRRAGVSAFGFGGNNAHLILEEWRGQAVEPSPVGVQQERIVLVDLEARVADLPDAHALQQLLQSGASRIRPRDGGALSAHADEVVLELEGLRFPPTDLERTIAQQTQLLGAARTLIARHPGLPRERTAVFVGMGCDADVARWGARWRFPLRAKGHTAEAIRAGQEALAKTLTASTVVGTMPNIPANRLSSQLDFGGPSHTVSAEEHSGLIALDLGIEALRNGDIDCALVGASDFSSEPVHEKAIAALLPKSMHVAGDASVVLVLMRESDALMAQIPVLAVLTDGLTSQASVAGSEASNWSVRPQEGARSLVPQTGHAHAASGLLHLVASALALTPTTPEARVESESIVGNKDVRTLALHPGLPRRPLVPNVPAKRPLRLVAHPARPNLNRSFPTKETSPKAPSMTKPSKSHLSMPAAPTLPSVKTHANGANGHANGHAKSAPRVQQAAPVQAIHAPPAQQQLPGVSVMESSPASDGFAVAQRSIAEAHRAFIAQQSALHAQFLAMREQSIEMLWSVPSVATEAELLSDAPVAFQAPIQAPIVHAPLAAPIQAPVQVQAPKPAPVAAPVAAPAAKKALAKPGAKVGGLKPADVIPTPRGPTFDREGLKIHAGGNISEIFGPLFAQQDPYAVVTRMPMEPMLLADRATGIEATPGVLGRGITWTETDVRWDSWYLHEGRMPGGVLIESGQADLFLISYMGIDFFNRSERAYRLLGCELTYHRSPPAAGETIDYDIHIDGHANQGPIRMFFFHYDCRVRPTGTPGPGLNGVKNDAYEGKPLLTVRNGQAGFFTRKELDDSAGILWKPEEQEIVAKPRLDAPAVDIGARGFSREELEAFSEGRVVDCFGEKFTPTRAHVRSPRIAGGRMLFLDHVDVFDAKGGPWKRGYLKATTPIHEDDWYFPGHFKNDPCMPGTLMFEGCLQAMAFYLTAMGFTLARDGWRFEPITDEPYKLLCRGQVTPTSKVLTYEIFVEEVVAGPIPMVYADLLCTVDGLGAFHARRMGLRMVPSWPLAERARLIDADALPPPHGEEPMSLSQMAPKKTVAVAPNGPSKGFVFDYASLVACAWGAPSKAFGPIYERFDTHRKVARLPGPPYHFMSRISKVEGDMGIAKAGAKVEVEYDVPSHAWYFEENGAAVMPYSVLMEAALQPCGWLASYIGCALLTDEDLLFRNLDGKATAHSEIGRDVALLRTRAHLKSFSQAGTMIIVAFDVALFAVSREGQETLAYSLDTVFGFFPTSAFENQAGLPISTEQKALYEAKPLNPIALDERPIALTQGSARLANPFLLMLDRVTHFDPRGGKAGKGALRAEKDVNPGEWFFRAHFFQDPVQPGSLGVEAMCQLLQLAMLKLDLHTGMKSPRFEAVGTGLPHAWKYRGQVVPSNRTIGCTVEVLEIAKDERGVFAKADASLWVDGKRIYDAKGLAMRIVDDATHATKVSRDEQSKTKQLTVSEVRAMQASHPIVIEETLDANVDTWLRDHCPTWVIPALPAMSMLSRMKRAATMALGVAVDRVEGMQIHRWATLPNGAIRLRTVATVTSSTTCDVAVEVFREAKDARLSRFEVICNAKGVVGPLEPAPFSTLDDAHEVGNPYAADALFHGPQFQLLTSLTMGKAGSRGVLAVPANPALREELLLDAATHVIPHDALHQWSDALPSDRAAYPYRIERAHFVSELPATGTVEVEGRFIEAGEHARLRLGLFAKGKLCVDISLVEVLLPKGPIGLAARADRAAFLRDARFVEGVSLAFVTRQETVLDARNIALSNWLPGTIERVYRIETSDIAAEVAVKDHLAHRLRVHPSEVLVTLHGSEAKAAFAKDPLTSFSFDLVREGTSIHVRERGPSTLDLQPLKTFWRRHLSTTGTPVGPWPGEDLYFALIERFMRRVRIENPTAFAKVKGRSALYLGNHQVGIESLLFGVTVSALTEVPTLTLAKQEHQDTWLGKLITHGFSYPGLKDPRVIAYFDRQDPASLPNILGELGARMKSGGQNVMIHVEGTRAVSCAQPVTKMSGVFVDLAITLNAPIVPVRFVHGLPREPLAERIEYPFGMGRQDYYVGAPIEPETLAKVPYKERTELVMSAINNLGPGHESEAPFESDPSFEAEVQAWAAHRNVTPAHAAVALAFLIYGTQHAGELSDEARACIEVLRTERTLDSLPHDVRGVWLRELAARLGG